MFLYFFEIVAIATKILGSKTYDKKPGLLQLSEEELKLFSLTRNNTLVNRDLPNKEEDYLKNAQPKYEELYGDKGTKFCQEELKTGKKEAKKVGRVKFSTIIQYSRN